jgi:hypothetical protein
VLRIVRDLLAFEPAHRGTDIAGAIDEANRMLSRRSVLFVVSDWRTGAASAPPRARRGADAAREPWEDALRVARMKHDVIPVVVRDRRERELPPIGLAEFIDEETGERVMVDLGSRGVRERFARVAAAEEALLNDSFRRLRAEPVMLETGGDFVEPLTAFFRKREGRRAR